MPPSTTGGSRRRGGLEAASAALARLLASRDLVVLEGAGSPAEINLGGGADIANMAMAERARAPVLLVSDIDRGGSFASLAGTLLLLPARHRRLVRGLVLNRFRGDPGILEPGFPALRRITGKPVLGVVPMMRERLPAEDSLDRADAEPFEWGRRQVAALDRRLDSLARTVGESLDMRAIRGMARGR